MSEKTEQPSAKKLRDAREKGQVAKSKDFTQNALLIALFAYIVAQGRQLMEDCSRLMMLPFAFIGGDFHQALSTLLEESMIAGARLLLPFLGIVIGVGIFAEALQTGVLFAFEAIKPSAKKLNVVENAANMFSKKNLIEFLKSLLKIAVLSWVIEALIVELIPKVMLVPHRGIAELGELIGELLKAIIIQTGVTTTVIALADLAWQRHQHTKGLMMSKDEVKQEYKGSEGDPHIKGKRKQLHQELMQGGAVESARKASVVVTNPTHLAIAIRYDDEAMPLPMVTGKGEGALAERMIAAARAAGVPVMQNIPLAHSLFREAEVDQYIPTDLIEPMAAVLRLVRQLAPPSAP